MKKLLALFFIVSQIANINAQNIIDAIYGPPGEINHEASKAFDGRDDTYYYTEAVYDFFSISCYLSTTVYVAKVTIKANVTDITVGDYNTTRYTNETFYCVYPNGTSSIEMGNMLGNLCNLYEVTIEKIDVELPDADLAYTYDDAGNMVSRTLYLSISPSQKSAEGGPLKDSLDEHTITIYPNPTKGMLKVQIDNLEYGDKVVYELADARGNSLQTGDINRKETSLDLNGQLPGIYYLQVAINSKAQTWTIIKE